MTNSDFHKVIPTWNNGVWETTEFNERKEFVDFLYSVFKEPGKYDLDETALLFNEHGRFYNEHGYYCEAPRKTKDNINFWFNQEKPKCIEGVIFKHNDKTWYLPREYYMWINYLPINDKMKKKITFPQVWDVQLHMALYECIAEFTYKHSVIVKKRQIASSYFHCAKLINKFWFDEGAVLKMGASQMKFVSSEGSWKFVEEYKNFLNEHTEWYRPLNPSSEGNWQQKIEVTSGGRTYTKGNKSTFTITSFEKNPTNGVGGPCSYFFYEEGGIAPTADKTFLYMKPALQMGDITTGMFIIAGSVGELKQCDPIKDFILNPDQWGFLGVETDLIDENGSRGIKGLFIPEQWGMPPYIDDYGNSLVEQALESLNKRFEQTKKLKDPAAYQLEISQSPRNIKEAFAYRDESVFPINLVESQKRNIEDNLYPYELVDLKENMLGEITVTKSNHAPILQYPVKKDLEDKQGAIQVWERPDKEIQYNQYIASIDPVREGKTTTSDSLVSIYVYKMPTHVNRETINGQENYIEGDKIVCCWCGRFDDPKQNHERLALILKWYKCRALCEANVPDFINYMIDKNLAPRYLVRKTEMLFLKEYSLNNATYNEYGWKNTNNMFKNILLPMMINFIKEVVDEEYNENGDIVKKHFGIEKIPDKMALEEMAQYTPEKNVDRLISLSALFSYVKIQLANHLTPTRHEKDEGLESNKNLYKLNINPFGRSKLTNDNKYQFVYHPFSRIK